jgi:putative Holliday junction resolvase
MTRYFVGLDWGKSKIGIALADDETRMAFAHSILRNDATFLPSLGVILREHAVETLVIGMPTNYVYGNQVGDEAREFGKRIGDRFLVKVMFFQEMFTTKMAQSNLLQSGKSKHKDDQEAARLILQGWLDNNHP